MGVVFTALFLLSAYMHYFKSVIARLESRGAAAPAPTPKPKARPEVKPIPVAPSAVPTEGARVAAAVAVGLHLAGVRAVPGGDLAAAVAVAMALHRGVAAPLPDAVSVRPASGWKLAGRMEAMTSRVKRHERPLGR